MTKLLSLLNEILPFPVDPSDLADALVDAEHKWNVKFFDDEKLECNPSILQETPMLQHAIGDATAKAARRHGLGPLAAVHFGEWFSGMLTGWSTRFANEAEVMELEHVFGQAAFGDPSISARICLYPSLRALERDLPAIKRGIEAVLRAAAEMA